MTDNNHSITPTPELMRQIRKDALWSSKDQHDYEERLIITSYRNGADYELEECCKWIAHETAIVGGVEALRAARRPNPKTLKDRGREALQNIHNAVVMETGGRELDVLKEIVESLPD